MFSPPSVLAPKRPCDLVTRPLCYHSGIITLFHTPCPTPNVRPLSPSSNFSVSSSQLLPSPSPLFPLPSVSYTCMHIHIPHFILPPCFSGLAYPGHYMHIYTRCFSRRICSDRLGIPFRVYCVQRIWPARVRVRKVRSLEPVIACDVDALSGF